MHCHIYTLVTLLLVYGVQADFDAGGLSIGVASTLALNYDPNQDGDTGLQGIADTTYNSSVNIPLDLSQAPFTLEFWVYWAGGTPGSEGQGIRTRQNQTLWFMGLDTSYVWLTPSDGVTPSLTSPGQSFPGWYDGSVRRAPVGPMRAKYGSANISRSLATTVRPGWTHMVVTFSSGGRLSVTSGPAASCPDGSTASTCPDRILNLQIPAGVPTKCNFTFGTTLSKVADAELSVAHTGQMKIGNIRMWNGSLFQQDLSPVQSVDLPDGYPGIIHQWRGNVATGFNFVPAGTLADSVGSASPASFTNCVWRSEAEAYTYDSQFTSPLPPTSLVPIDTLMRNIDAQSSFSFTMLGRGVYTGYYGNPTRSYYLVLAGQDPNYGRVDFNATVNGGGTNNNTLNARYTPDRAACGNTVALSFFGNWSNTVSSANIWDATNTVTAQLTVLPPPNMNLAITPLSIPTLGGPLSISGSSLGLPGALGVDESITLNILTSSAASLTGTVNSTAVSFNIPAGYGAGNLTVQLCNRVWAIPFSYHAPTVSNVTGLNATMFKIQGSNFGPTRSLAADPSSYIIINGSTCQILSLQQDTIICTVPGLTIGSNYTVSLVIGYQNVSAPFVFGLCDSPCLNGGTCINVNKCNCPLTHTGGSCEEAVTCNPDCKNGGICQRDVTSQDGATYCECPPGAPNTPGCNILSSGQVPVIVGASVGGAVLIFAIAGAVIFFVMRRPARKAAKNFIAVDKKDFAKIIYGDQLTQAPEKNAGNTKGLETLLQEDMKAAFAISEMTQITEADKIAKALVVVYQDHNRAINLLEAFIDQEVETSESAGTLFRSNSMVSKMFKFYSRLIGLPYLYVTVGPEISKLIEEELGLEVDPEKMEEGKDLDEMRWSLMSQSQKILKQIMVSENDCPSQFRELFAHLKTSVGGRFPDNINTTIGGFIFLRFFCPAVSSPEAYGIVDEPPSADSRRLLILVTKVLQNLSNDVEFGSKEPYMSKMNDFIQSNRLKLAEFYNRLTKTPTKPPVECVLPKNIKALSLGILLNHIRDNISRVTDAETKAKFEAVLA